MGLPGKKGVKDEQMGFFTMTADTSSNKRVLS